MTIGIKQFFTTVCFTMNKVKKGVFIVSQTQYASYNFLFQLTLHTQSYIFQYNHYIKHQMAEKHTELCHIGSCVQLKVKLQHEQLLQNFSCYQKSDPDR